MTKVVVFCGIDVSKMHFDVSFAKEETISCPRRFNYDAAGIEVFPSTTASDSHCVMESTGTYHYH
jgi:transposase